MTDDELLALAAVDVENAYYLAGIGDRPVPVRAVKLVRELAERVAAQRVR